VNVVDRFSKSASGRESRREADVDAVEFDRGIDCEARNRILGVDLINRRSAYGMQMPGGPATIEISKTATNMSLAVVRRSIWPVANDASVGICARDTLTDGGDIQ
jgi:hypothetical protein